MAFGTTNPTTSQAALALLVNKANTAGYNPGAAGINPADIAAAVLAVCFSDGFPGSVLGNSATSVVGFQTGAGGAVTQATSKSTGVTLNKPCGVITMNAANLAATTSVAFTLTNSVIAATDVVLVNLASGNTANSYFVSVDAVAAGSCSISLRNYTAGGLAEAVVLNFVVVKGVSA